MAVIESKNTIDGTFGPLRTAGAPGAGTNAVDTLTFAATWADGDTFKLKFNGFTTADIAWSATNSTLVANIDAALEALPNIGTGGVVTATGTMTSGIGTITLTAGGNLAKTAMPLIDVAEYTTAGNGTVASAETTPGVAADHRGLATGGLVEDTTNGKLYINTGTPQVPVYTVVGSQS